MIPKYHGKNYLISTEKEKENCLSPLAMSLRYRSEHCGYKEPISIPKNGRKNERLNHFMFLCKEVNFKSLMKSPCKITILKLLMFSYNKRITEKPVSGIVQQNKLLLE